MRLICMCSNILGMWIGALARNPWGVWINFGFAMAQCLFGYLETKNAAH